MCRRYVTFVLDLVCATAWFNLQMRSTHVVHNRSSQRITKRIWRFVRSKRRRLVFRYDSARNLLRRRKWLNLRPFNGEFEMRPRVGSTRLYSNSLFTCVSREMLFFLFYFGVEVANESLRTKYTQMFSFGKRLNHET